MSTSTPVFDVRLDPDEVAIGRTELALNDGPIRIDQAGIDWGDAAIQAYQADQLVGTTTIDYRLPNRNIVIPLFLGADESGEFDAAKNQLMQKVARIQTEGVGWLKRADGIYADVVNATLTFPDVYGEPAGFESGVSLNLECLPDFYGDEIDLDLISTTGTMAAVLKEGGAQASVDGAYPGRVRIRVRAYEGLGEFVGENGLLWGWRSRHYDSAPSAALIIDAEGTLPPTVTGAQGFVATRFGASGGKTMSSTGLTAGSWITFMYTDLWDGTHDIPLTHVGSYRVWARCWSHQGSSAQLRLVWGPATAANAIINPAATLNISNDFSIVDLGMIRLGPAPLGNHQWTGFLQALGGSSDQIEVDQLYFQPVDEGSGKLNSVSRIAPAIVTAGPLPANTLTPHSTGSSVPWTIGSANPLALGMTGMTAAGQVSDDLFALNMGFNIPAAATITGLRVDISRSTTPNAMKDAIVSLSHAGDSNVPTPPGKASTTIWPGGNSTATYGGPNDLWGSDWTPSDVNDANTGVLLQVQGQGTHPACQIWSITMTVYYVVGAVALSAQDAVIFYDADGTQYAELRTDGMYRASPAPGVYGPVSQVLGDLPRIPTSGLEDRAVELFLRPSNSDFATLADSHLDNFDVAVVYRPSWLFPPT